MGVVPESTTGVWEYAAAEIKTRKGNVHSAQSRLKHATGDSETVKLNGIG